MKIPHRPRQRQLQMNMAPMIDVVFLLIIFFLVSSHLAKQEVQAEMNLPAAESGKQQPSTVSPKVTINVASDNGRHSVKLGALPVTMAELSSRLRQELRAKGPNLEVRIRADRTTPYHIIEPILLACAKCDKPGIWNVKFAVVRPEGN